MENTQGSNGEQEANGFCDNPALSLKWDLHFKKIFSILLLFSLLFHLFFSSTLLFIIYELLSFFNFPFFKNMSEIILTEFCSSLIHYLYCDLLVFKMFILFLLTPRFISTALQLKWFFWLITFFCLPSSL